jgi:hypothetical protein
MNDQTFRISGYYNKINLKIFLKKEKKKKPWFDWLP